MAVPLSRGPSLALDLRSVKFPTSPSVSPPAAQCGSQRGHRPLSGTRTQHGLTGDQSGLSKLSDRYAPCRYTSVGSIEPKLPSMEHGPPTGCQALPAPPACRREWPRGSLLELEPFRKKGALLIITPGWEAETVASYAEPPPTWGSQAVLGLSHGHHVTDTSRSFHSYSDHSVWNPRIFRLFPLIDF